MELIEIGHRRHNCEAVMNIVTKHIWKLDYLAQKKKTVENSVGSTRIMQVTNRPSKQYLCLCQPGPNSAARPGRGPTCVLSNEACDTFKSRISSLPSAL